MKTKQIKDLEYYSVDEYGNVYNDKGLKLKPQINRDGYATYNLFNRESKKFCHKRANRLVAEAFIPNPDNLPIVHHIDHDKLNNHVSNLKWVTPLENTQESLKYQPEKHRHRATVDDEVVHGICRMIENYCTNKDIMDKYGVGVDLIRHIRSGNSWTHISCNYSMKGAPRTRLSLKTLKWLYYKIQEGYTNHEIMQMSTCKSLNKGHIKGMRSGKKYKKFVKEFIEMEKPSTTNCRE